MACNWNLTRQSKVCLNCTRSTKCRFITQFPCRSSSKLNTMMTMQHWKCEAVSDSTSIVCIYIIYGEINYRRRRFCIAMRNVTPALRCPRRWKGGGSFGWVDCCIYMCWFLLVFYCGVRNCVVPSTINGAP